MRGHMQRKHWLAFATALAVMLAVWWIYPSPTKAPSKDRVSLRLQWFPQAQFAGYIVAQRLGYYSELGLDVDIRPAGPDLKPQMTVAAGTDDVAVGVSNQVITARSNGVPLKIIAQIFQDSANRYVLKRDNAISSLKALRGKKVGLWLGGDEAEFVAMLKSQGMVLQDVDVVAQGYTVTPFLQNQYVLSQVTIYNELLQLEDVLRSKEALQIISPGEYKAAIVSDMLFTTESFINNRRSVVERLLTASIRGWKFCIEQPERAVEMVLAANPELKKDEQLRQMRAVLGLVSGGGASSRGIGFMDEAYYSTAERVLFESGQIRTRVGALEIFDQSVWNAVPETVKTLSEPK